MKHLIIPTDFSLRSLEPVRAAITHFAGESLAVTLLHLLEPPTDIISGLRLAYRAGSQPAIPQAFTLAMESVAAVYSEQIRTVKVKRCHGSTVPAVRNLLEHFGADAILFNPQQSFEQPSPQSFDPRPLLRRAMPHCIVEVSTPVRAAMTPPTSEVPTRVTAKGRLQPARINTANNSSSTTRNFPRHAS